jgi:hypothetical protein
LKNRAEVAQNRIAKTTQLGIISRFRRGGIEKGGPAKAETLEFIFQQLPGGSVPFQAELDLRHELFTGSFRFLAQFGTGNTTKRYHHAFPTFDQFGAKLPHPQECSYRAQVS